MLSPFCFYTVCFIHGKKLYVTNFIGSTQGDNDAWRPFWGSEGFMKSFLKYNLMLWAFFVVCILGDFGFFAFTRSWGFGHFYVASLFEYEYWKLFMAVVVLYLAFKGSNFVGCEFKMETTKSSVAWIERINNFYARMLIRLLLTALHVSLAVVILGVVILILTCVMHWLPGDCTM